MYRENDDLNDLINTLNGLSPNLNGEENNMDDDKDQPTIFIGNDDLLSKEKPIIRVLGVGGAGNNTVTNLFNVNIFGVETIAANTDATQLYHSKAQKKLLLGRKTCGGLGAGNNPLRGEEAAKESTEDIKRILAGTDLLFLTCGLGGGTGSGATPYIAKLAKEMGILTVTVCTLPFSVEGGVRIRNAERSLKKLVEYSTVMIIIPNDKLLHVAPNAKLQEAFKMADDILVKAVQGITDIIMKPGLINVDYSDVRQVLTAGGMTFIGIGEADGNSKERAMIAIERALSNKLIDLDITTAKRALLNITGGPNLTLDETHNIIGRVSALIKKDLTITENEIEENDEVIYGIILDSSLKSTIRVTVVLSGIESNIFDENGNLIRDLFYNPRNMGYGFIRRKDLFDDIEITRLG
ncbi:MAG: cell division protein FtsZ [Candidatus Njordarchaeum guaymaensis]